MGNTNSQEQPGLPVASQGQPLAPNSISIETPSTSQGLVLVLGRTTLFKIPLLLSKAASPLSSLSLSGLINIKTLSVSASTKNTTDKCLDKENDDESHTRVSASSSPRRHKEHELLEEVSPELSIPWKPSPALSSPTGEYLVARHRSTLRVTLNRPSRGNALSLGMVEGLTALVREHVNRDATVHRVVITGKGRYFCTGMDLGSPSASSLYRGSSSPTCETIKAAAIISATTGASDGHSSSHSNSRKSAEEEAEKEETEEQQKKKIEQQEDDDDPLFSPAQISVHARLLTTLFHTIDTCPKQTIALLNGPAFGGGVGLLTVCDIRLAGTVTNLDNNNTKSKNIFFCCLSEVHLGLCPATIAQYLVREWGPSLARMAMLSGRRIGAEDLLRAGVLHGLLEIPPPPSCVGTTSQEKEEHQSPLEKAFVKDWLLPSLRYAAPGAVGLCKGLVKATVDGADMDRHGVRTFEEMLSLGVSTGVGKHMHEARVGVGLFRKGVKGVVWEEIYVNLEKDNDKGRQAKG